MAKARVCDRLIMVLTNRKGMVTTKDIETDLEYGSMYRIATELWRAKKRGAVIKTYRDGRTVTGYELMNVEEMKTYLNNKGFASFSPAKSATPTKVATVKPAKTAKATKQAKAAPVAEVVEVKTVAPVDVLDEIDTDITDFEDREYAEGFAKGTV